MRVLVCALVLAAMTLSGCAGYELEGLVPPPGEDGGNWTVEPAPAVAVSPEPEVAPVSSYPVADIAVADYTAPVALEIDRMEGEYATLSLVADATGLRCVSQPLRDPLASPAGYRAVSSWARCSLESDGILITAADAESMQADMPILQGIPVEGFTWNMTVGRVLVNNTGEHEEILEEVLRDESTAPSAHVDHAIDQGGLMYSSYRYEVCDTPLYGGLAQVRIATTAHNGRAMLSVDLEGFDWWWVEGSGDPVAHAGNATNSTGAVWWQEGSVVHALGAWGHASVAELTMEMYFRGDGSSLAILPPPECMDALFRDIQSIPIGAGAIGIAAGWEDIHDHDLPVIVWHSP